MSNTIYMNMSMYSCMYLISIPAYLLIRNMQYPYMYISSIRIYRYTSTHTSVYEYISEPAPRNATTPLMPKQAVTQIRCCQSNRFHPPNQPWSVHVLYDGTLYHTHQDHSYIYTQKYRCVPHRPQARPMLEKDASHLSAPRLSGQCRALALHRGAASHWQPIYIYISMVCSVCACFGPSDDMDQPSSASFYALPYSEAGLGTRRPEHQHTGA